MSVLSDFLVFYEATPVPDESTSSSVSPATSITGTSRTDTETTNSTVSSRSSNRSFLLSHYYDTQNLLLFHRLSLITHDTSCCTDEDLNELNRVDWDNLNKKEKKKLRKTNPQFRVNFNKSDDRITSKDIGVEWDRAFRAYVKNDWEKFKFVANGDV